MGGDKRRQVVVTGSSAESGGWPKPSNCSVYGNGNGKESVPSASSGAGERQRESSSALYRKTSAEVSADGFCCFTTEDFGITQPDRLPINQELPATRLIVGYFIDKEHFTAQARLGRVSTFQVLNTMNVEKFVIPLGDFNVSSVVFLHFIRIACKFDG